MTNLANLTNSKKPGGYENLLVFWLATIIYDLTVQFCGRFVDKRSRTHDQMVQAARSGKQNIVEGSLENSVEGNLKLTGVARASFGELLEDYKDFLRQKGFSLWGKDDPRVMEIRRQKIQKQTNWTNWSNLAYLSYLGQAESFANLLITLCFLEGFLLDRLLAAQKEKFVREGGFKENLFKKRMEFKRNQQ